nr:hypothetical protein [Tanacetum cinerariifolium]
MLEKKRQFKSSGLKRLKKVGTLQRVESSHDTVMDDQEDASKQGEIAELDTDEDVTLEEVDVEITKDADVQGGLEESQAKVMIEQLQLEVVMEYVLVEHLLHPELVVAPTYQQIKVVTAASTKASASILPKVDNLSDALDIQNAFLHGNLKERVYMKQPPGFIVPQRPNHVCLLHKSLYGLKQAPYAWFERLSKALFDLCFKCSKTDPSLFTYSCGDTLLYILVYVDDIIVTCNNKGTINNIIFQLGSAFALKDLRPLNYFLGIEIVPHVSSILLSQKKYILELLQSAGLSNCNHVSSPMVTLSSLSLDDSTAFSNLVKYQQVVGSLQYVTLSRPNIAFAVNKVCQYMHASIENHWSAVKQILRYLHGTVEHGMLTRRSFGSTLQAFTDVLWKGNPDTSLYSGLYPS